MPRTRVFPFNETTNQYLRGTGRLFVVEDGLEVDVGNVSLLDFVAEGSTFRVFTEDDDGISVVVVTTGYRFNMRGDSYSMENLGRLLNEPEVNVAGSTRYNLTTIRKAELREVIFEKDLQTDQFCIDGCPESLQVRLWRTHLVGPFTLSFATLTLTEHNFSIVALPDDINHASNPFGRVDEICAAPAS